MTDITELAQSLQRRATSAKEFGESLYVKADDVLADRGAGEGAGDGSLLKNSMPWDNRPLRGVAGAHRRARAL